MLQKSGRLVLWEAMFILELHSAETQEIVMITNMIMRFAVIRTVSFFVSWIVRRVIIPAAYAN